MYENLSWTTSDIRYWLSETSSETWNWLYTLLWYNLSHQIACNTAGNIRPVKWLLRNLKPIDLSWNPHLKNIRQMIYFWQRICLASCLPFDWYDSLSIQYMICSCKLMSYVSPYLFTASWIPGVFLKVVITCLLAVSNEHMCFFYLKLYIIPLAHHLCVGAVKQRCYFKNGFEEFAIDILEARHIINEC